MRSRKLFVVALFLPLIGASVAQASPLCERLYERLAELPSVTSNRPTGTSRDLIGALSRHNLDLRAARGQARRMGCSGGSITIINGENDALCRQIDERIAALRDEIDALKAQRLADLNGTEHDAARRRVMVALSANRCDETQDAIVSASVGGDEQPRNIIADLPPIGSEQPPVLRGRTEFPELEFGDQAGDLRTMCVRTCDGAFFPISAHASPADFPRDAEACSRRCPGAETELYYHPLTSGDTESMVSAETGKLYSDLPTAFAYKTGDPADRKQCGCALTPRAAAPVGTPITPGGSISTVTSDPGRAAPTQSAAADPAASAAPSSPASPSAAAAPAVAPPIERPYDPKANRVRQVGPTFLPAEETAIDLRHPKGPAFQPQQAN